MTDMPIHPTNPIALLIGFVAHIETLEQGKKVAFCASLIP
jgi:hypothetical protein